MASTQARTPPGSAAEHPEIIEYLATKNILIADTVSGSRAGLAKIVISMGARTNQVFMCSNFQLAETEIARVKPQIIIADYDIGKRCGLDLIPMMRVHYPNPKDCIFMLVTGNNSQSAVAEAAEEDVDIYVLKPYTIEVVKNLIRKAITAKVTPTDYMRKIDEGKEHLLLGEFEKAKAKFAEAIELDKKPSLALFYHGQAELMQKAYDAAQSDYEEGLEYNKIHYKCLTGLFDLLMQKKEFAQAYDVVKRIARYFPANPTRLAQVLRLAIMTKAYEDVEKYYQIFMSMDLRNDEMVRYMCAALIVCGKYYLRGGHTNRALELMRNAATTSAGRPKILREIIQSLCEFKHVKEAATYLNRFPPETQDGVDYLTMTYLVASLTQPSSAIVEQGRRLLKNVEDQLIYKILIEHSLRCKLTDSAQNLLSEAQKKFPANAVEFQTVYELTSANLAEKK
jgi:DNA-binding NarL/FixJ family response regulator